MKLNAILAAAAALLLATSCGIFGAGNGTQTPTGSGQASGAALRNLYTQYKTDGKIDMTNINNILNLAALSQCIGELKDAGKVDKSEYVKEFATGLILGSNNLVNQTNSTPVVGGLTNLAGINLSSVTTAAAGLLANGITTANAAAQQAAAQQAAAQQAAAQQAAAATQQAATATTNTASAITNAISTVGAATNEVTQAVSTLSTIFNLFK
ncbi:MAG: hypothetical protein IJM05_01095 [Bacteroidales bacterium]|nr:hypothetical protein [Bacteroidales bacterium]MBR3500549.1 hypothetical protein [Bacteroidales bacterium]